MTRERPATRQSVADGRQLYRDGAKPVRSTSTADDAPTVEELTGSAVLLGRTRARAARGDRAAGQAIAAFDAAWRAIAETGGDAA